jgi:hypothetical protein
MKNLQFTGTIHANDDGAPVMRVNNRAELAQRVWELADCKPANIELIVRVIEDPKDNSDQRYYWGTVLPAIVRAEYERGTYTDEKKMNKKLKKKCGAIYDPEKKRYTTKGMSDKAYKDYVDRVCAFAAEWWGIAIPPKGDYYFPQQ